MANALERPDLDLALDVTLDITAEVTLDRQVLVDVGTDLVDLGLDRNTKVNQLTEDEVNKIRSYVDQNLTIEGDLRRDVQADIKRKIEIGSLQGVRHRKGLPVRGQRTHTNARTRKGPKRTVANKKKAVRK